jgi:choline dehydrogenase
MGSRTIRPEQRMGHHAFCTCEIGPNEDNVLDKDFLVRETENLRVVDASVFPRIPGLFILSSVYMISEKASDVIINNYKS